MTSLSIQARISKKESAGIYDYVADKYEEKCFNVGTNTGTSPITPGMLASDRNDQLSLLPIKKQIPPGSEFKGLLSFNKLKNGSYCIRPEQLVTSELGLWMITRREESV